MREWNKPEIAELRIEETAHSIGGMHPDGSWMGEAITGDEKDCANPSYSGSIGIWPFTRTHKPHEQNS